MSSDLPGSADMDRLAAEWERQRGRKPKLLTPLPWRTRARLAVHHAVDAIGLPLARRGHYRAAKRLWRLFGMWRLPWTT